MHWLQRRRGLSRNNSAISLSDLSLISARDADARMAGLEHLLRFVLGDRNDEYGETEPRLQACKLPAPLERFYRFAGCWPVPHPNRSPIIFETPAESYFYVGVQFAHLVPLDDVKPACPGQIEVFWEQSGNWIGITSVEGIDPPVRIQNALGLNKRSDPVDTGETLSGWLVAHSLGTLAWESANSYCCATVEGAKTGPGLALWFASEKENAARLWVSHQTICHELSGTFFAIGESILVHECGNLLRFAALTPRGAEQLNHRAAKSDNLE